jgi:hypothetical protein
MPKNTTPLAAIASSDSDTLITFLRSIGIWCSLSVLMFQVSVTPFANLRSRMNTGHEYEHENEHDEDEDTG